MRLSAMRLCVGVLQRIGHVEPVGVIQYGWALLDCLTGQACTGEG